MNLNAANLFKTNDVIFSQGEKSDCIYMVLKGKVELSNPGFSIVMGAGTLMGVRAADSEDVLAHYTCMAKEDATVFVVSPGDLKSLAAFLGGKKEYCGIAVYNHCRLIQEQIRQFKKLNTLSAKLFKAVKDGYSEYIEMARKGGFRTCLLPAVVQFEEYLGTADISGKEMELPSEYCKIPYDNMKSFFGFSEMITIQTLLGIIDTENKLFDACSEAADYVCEAFEIMMSGEEGNLFKNLLGLGIDQLKNGGDSKATFAMVDSLLELTTYVKDAIGAHTNRTFSIDADGLKKLADDAKAGVDFRGDAGDNVKTIDSNIAAQITDLADSFDKLIEYGHYDEDKVDDFRELLETYIGMKDRESADDEYRKLRKSLAEHFYALYLKVFMVSVDEIRIPKAAELMLNYGYLSEKLLTENQLSELLSIQREADTKPCSVYTMREWLIAIYNGEKEPSRNDMGQDFAEHLRELRKSGTITEETAKEYANSGEKKVEYEIRDVLFHGNRVVNGQLSTFVPILHSEQFMGDLVRAYSNPMKINDALLEIENLDFSLFYREALFVDSAAGIEKETIVKKVYPVFILYPTVGMNTIMWQEITGRKRDTEGRFFAPAFSYVAMKDMLIKAFGQFRWALCKTIQGTNWNNIQIRSLTSEYADYIQFFKKNRDLSEERKEKLKLQIQRGRNNLREVFTLDYENWMKNESVGSVRMNKVAREMLAMYCPFSAQYREQLTKQPIYDEAFARYTRECNKKVHELELRYRALEAKKVVLPDCLKETLAFYKDM